VLFEQWRIAFEIGAQNKIRGTKPASVFRLIRLVLEKWHHRGERSGAELRLKGEETDSVSRFVTEI
jgi:hypothetical protein